MLIALEPRLMFDGAGVATIDPLRDGPSGGADPFATVSRAATPLPDLRELASADTAPSFAGSRSTELVVIDGSVRDVAALVESLDPALQVLILDPARDGLMQIAEAVSQRTSQITALHIVSHGALGQISLGSRTIDTAGLSAYRSELAAIGNGLTSEGDILLYGCDVADGPQGTAFLQAIAAATGADVAGSTDATGVASLGGDWVLEAAVGSIETSAFVSEASAAAWSHLLADAPAVTLSIPSASVLLGESFQITANFDNAGADAGFGPYLDIFVPAQGADGGGSPDGISISGASYLGRSLTVTQIVLTGADITAGTVAHPYARDTLGGDRVALPAALVAGDRLVVVELPFGSYTADQPVSQILIDASLSSFADVGSPLSVLARAGFRYGADPLNNPATDPSTQSGTVALVVTPVLYRLSTTYVGPENETATGPNHQRAYRIDVDLAEGQTLSTLDLSAVLDPGMQFSPISGTPSAIGGTSIGAAPSGGWTNASGVLVSAAASGTSAPGAPGGSVVRGIPTITGTSGAIDLSMVVGFYVPERDANASAVLDAATGDSATLVFGTAIAAAWDPLDARDAVAAISASDSSAHRLEAESIAIQQTRTVAFDAQSPGLTPIDELRYTLDIQVSDYFAFGGSATGPAALQVVDTLSDGLRMVDSTAGPFADPVLQVVRSGGAVESYSLTRGVHYTVTTQGDGRQQIVFDLAAALPSGAGQVLVGDLFAGDAVQTGGTSMRLTFSAQVLEQYRVAPPDASGAPTAGSSQLDLNQGDRLVNTAIVSGTVLSASLDPDAPGLFSAVDDTLSADRIAGNAVSIVIWGVNRQNVSSTPSDPVRIAPGDTVSYVMTYVVPTGDFEQFKLTAYLPLPVFDVTDPDRDGTASPFALMPGPYYAKPPAGEFSFEVTGGDGAGVPVPVVSTLASDNGVQFFFGDRSDATDSPVTILVAFTVTAGDQSFADTLFLAAQAQAVGASTSSESVESLAIDGLRFSAPQLALFKGVVQDDVDVPTSAFDPVYSTGRPDLLLRPAGDGAADPRSATIGTEQVATLDANVSEVDANDTLRFAIVVQNLGQSERGAFDVTLRDQLPTGVDPASIANLRLTLGDGRAIYDGSGGTLANLLDAGSLTPVASEAAAIAALFGINGLQLADDPGADTIVGTADDRGALGGSLGAGGVPAAAGSNILIVTYDARLLPGVEAGSTRSSSATLTRYAGLEGGVDLTPVDLTDAASITVVLPALDKRILTTSEPDTTTAGLDAVIGERVSYEVTLAIPEGTVTGAQFVDTLDSGLSFVTIDAITASPGLAFSGGLPLPGAIVPVSVGGDANRITIPFGTITNANADNAIAESITVRYTVVVANVVGNQQDVRQNNFVELTSVAATVSDAAPELRIVEPSVAVTLVPSATQPDAGDEVRYVLTITAAAGGPPAFDLELDVANLVPAGLSYVGGSLVQTAGPAAASLAFGGPGVVGNWAALASGQQIVVRFDTQVSQTADVGDVFDQDATLRFSSLPGTGNTDLSAPAVLGDFERTGAVTDPGGALNDYRVLDSASVSVSAQTPVLTLVASSEPSSIGSSVVPGEVLRLRMVVQVPEGTAPSAEIVPTLPAGLRFVNDGSVTLAFVANGGGVDSTTIAGSAFDLTGGGADAAAISAILPTQVMPGAAIVDGLGAPIASGTVMAAGSAPRFVLGDLNNADRDADKEFVVIEFNTIVDNASGQLSGAANPVVFEWRTDGTSRGQSNLVGTTLGEPSIVDLDKRVISVTGSQVTFESVFTNTGNEEAHDVRLTDTFAGAINLSFDGAGSVTGLPAGATNASVADALVVTLPTLAPGASVAIRYVATVTDMSMPVPPRDAEVVYTSLSASGLSLTTATSAGSVVTSTTGERTGSTLDYGAAVNTYRDTDPAGLNKLTGTLWDDTDVPDGAIGGAEARLEGLTVTLVHAGLDGSFGTGDDLSFTAVTDVNGYYGFGALPSGDIRITAPTVVANGNGSLGELRPRTDVQGAPTDSLIEATIASGILYSNQNFGYVQINDPPTVSAPAGPLSVAEDTPLPIAGISVGDPDARATTTNTVTLTVGAGTLVLTPGAGVVAAGIGSATVTLTGSIADLNAALATLVYQGTRDANGPDRLDLRIDDRGNTGDADGDRLPGEPADDNLFAITSVAIVVSPVNDAPTARPDARTITEDQRVSDGAAVAGGPPGDLSDTDVDGDPLSVVGVVAGTAGGPLTGGVGVPVVSALGTLTLFGDGRYTYDPAVDLQAGVSVQDVFSYSVSDGQGGTATTTITITITGANDPPQALPDANRVAADSTTGVSGNVIGGGAATDRPDVDTDAGDLLTVQGVAAGASPGPLSGAVGTPVAGTYGSLLIGPDGAYTYRVDPAAASVLELRPGQSLIDTFSYTVVDRAGATSTTTVTITIDGVDDPPRAQPDLNRVSAQSTVAATGNVIGGGSAGDAPDTDPDGDPLTVQGVRPGADPSTPVASGVGAAVPGGYGSLVLNADGSYAYTVDPTSPEVRALRPGESLSEVYTYTVRDPSGQVATTTLTIVIDGVNDAPVAGSVRQTLDQSQPPGAPPAVVPPTVTDVDNTATELTVRIDTIGRPEAGTFLRPDGQPVVPGDMLTVSELQNLRYQPAPAYAAPPSADGTLPGSALAFTVTDPSGGSAPGSIEIALRPTFDAAPPAPPSASSSVPPLLDSATGAPSSTSPSVPGALGDTPVTDMLQAVAGDSAFGAGLVASEGAMLRPYTMGALAAPPGLDDVPGDYVRQAVLEARHAMEADRLRLDAKSGRLDLDAGGLFPSNRVDGMFGEERIGPTRDWSPMVPPPAVAVAPALEAATVASPAVAPVLLVDDCDPQPKPKPKPVKRIPAEPLVRPAPSFSEQLDVQKKKFRAPAQVAPKLPPARQC
jgi:fimbrial isopeptide formation D2 family protein/uncharacterized repeat protein (TIGR01451 family)